MRWQSSSQGEITASFFSSSSKKLLGLRRFTDLVKKEQAASVCPDVRLWVWVCKMDQKIFELALAALGAVTLIKIGLSLLSFIYAYFLRPAKNLKKLGKWAVITVGTWISPKKWHMATSFRCERLPGTHNVCRAGFDRRYRQGAGEAACQEGLEHRARGQVALQAWGGREGGERSYWVRKALNMLVRHCNAFSTLRIRTRGAEDPS